MKIALCVTAVILAICKSTLYFAIYIIHKIECEYFKYSKRGTEEGGDFDSKLSKLYKKVSDIKKAFSVEALFILVLLNGLFSGGLASLLFCIFGWGE